MKFVSCYQVLYNLVCIIWSVLIFNILQSSVSTENVKNEPLEKRDEYCHKKKWINLKANTESEPNLKITALVILRKNILLQVTISTLEHWYVHWVESKQGSM